MRRRYLTQDSKSNNIVYYTSTDNNIISLPTYAFNVIILSNIYNEKGIITCNGNINFINNKAFYYCDKLETITIPNSVTRIGDRAFHKCISLTSAVIGNSVRSIGDYAFYGCESLTSIEIPNSVTSIGKEVFYYCTSLTSAVIGNSVTSIGFGAFHYCSRLTSVYVKVTTPPTLDASVFKYNHSNRKIYVPRASLNAYKTASGWSNYASAIVPYDY